MTERWARCAVSTSRQVRLRLCLWNDEDPGTLDLSPEICMGYGGCLSRPCAGFRKLYQKEGGFPEGQQGDYASVRAYMGHVLYEELLFT